MVGIFGAKAREHDAALVRHAIAIGVFEMQQLGGISDVHPTVSRHHRSRDE